MSDQMTIDETMQPAAKKPRKPVSEYRGSMVLEAIRQLKLDPRVIRKECGLSEGLFCNWRATPSPWVTPSIINVMRLMAPQVIRKCDDMLKAKEPVKPVATAGTSALEGIVALLAQDPAGRAAMKRAMRGWVESP